MAEERVKRRLAAILAADVVGYNRLMGEDEAGTLAALKEHRALVIDPKVAGYDGRIVKLMGDGTLAERAAIPPSGPGSAWLVKTPVLPDGHRPRGTAAPARASHPAFDRDPAPTHRPRPRTDPAAMSVLCTENPAPAKSLGDFVTQ